MRYWLILPAAGIGRRFGEPKPKQYCEIRGRTLLEWSLQPFMADARCAGIVVALAPEDPFWPAVEKKLARIVKARIVTTQGGPERGHSVRNGLAVLQRQLAANDWVLVHD